MGVITNVVIVTMVKPLTKGFEPRRKGATLSLFIIDMAEYCKAAKNAPDSFKLCYLI